MDSVACVPTFEDLRRHVLLTLCHHDHLDPDSTPINQALILRRQIAQPHTPICHVATFGAEKGDRPGREWSRNLSWRPRLCYAIP
jgi:hypothetical protein